jgi:hypothetical protein
MNPRTDPLGQLLAQLPRAVPPPRDLWPAIAAATSGTAPAQAARSTAATAWGLRLAAGLACTALGAALAWSVLRGPAAQAVAGGRAPAGAHALQHVWPGEGEFLAARAQMHGGFENQLARLAPATRARVEGDLLAIQRANEDIRAALEHDGASPLLLQLLRQTWQQELGLYSNLSQTTEPLQRSTRT